MTLYVDRAPGDRLDIHLADSKQGTVTVTQPEIKRESKPAVRKPRTATKTVARPAAKPKKAIAVSKPAPKPTASKPSPVARPKPAVTPKPAPQKQGFLSRAVRGATSLTSRAASWIGTRYIWGGLSSQGVDCSGLTSLLYKSLGVALPHSARQQYKMGQAIAKKELVPGDLVFFNTTGAISHVGMYIGDNKFVHAANRHRGVRTDSLDASYYSKRYVGARRYI